MGMIQRCTNLDGIDFIPKLVSGNAFFNWKNHYFKEFYHQIFINFNVESTLRLKSKFDSFLLRLLNTERDANCTFHIFWKYFQLLFFTKLLSRILQKLIKVLAHRFSLMKCVKFKLLTWVNMKNYIYMLKESWGCEKSICIFCFFYTLV